MKKICIFGSSGYIGSFLCQYLKKDFNIISHSRKKITNKKFCKNIKNFVYGDILKPKTIDNVIKLKPDKIIYTISLNHFDSEANLQDSIKINVLPFLYLLEKIIKKKLNIEIIYFSTMQVYGREYTSRIINETNPKNLNNIYALTHSICEDALLINKQKIKFSILRLSNSFGMPVFPKNNVWWPVVNDICKMAKKKRFIKLQSDGSPQRDFISLNTIASFIKKLLNNENKKNNIINLCSGKTFTILEIAKKVANNPFFLKSIPIIKKKTSKNKIKKFNYDNRIMKKFLEKNNFNIQEEISNFLEKI